MQDEYSSKSDGPDSLRVDDNCICLPSYSVYSVIHMTVELAFCFFYRNLERN